MTTAGKVVDINSAQVRARLRAVVSLIGEASLGFPAVETGLHSIRSGAAIAMFLSGVSTIIIQRVGRWKSDAFLEYIRVSRYSREGMRSECEVLHSVHHLER